MKSVAIILVLSLVHLGTFHLYAQENPMAKLSGIVGEWEGTATTTNQQGTFKVKQHEDVRFELNKDIIIVKGEGRMADTDSLAFQAFGVIHYDKMSQKYQFSAFTGGQYVLAEIELTDKGFDWHFDTPNGGTVKYSLQFTDSTWVEDGKYSSDGQNWYPFFHMELNKIK